MCLTHVDLVLTRSHSISHTAEEESEGVVDIKTDTVHRKGQQVMHARVWRLAQEPVGRPRALASGSNTVLNCTGI